MIILRALPLSLSIFWRMVLVLPILLIVLASFTLVAVILGVVLTLAGLPTLMFLTVMAVMLSFFTTPLLVGSRMGLQIHGVRPRNGVSQLLWPSTGYGLVVGFLTVLIVTIAGLGFFLLTDNDKFDVAQMTGAIAQRGALSAAVEFAGPLLLAFAAATITIHAIYACLLLPLASASVGRDANGNAHTPFAGFGAGFIPLLAIVTLVWLINYTLPTAVEALRGIPWVDAQITSVETDLLTMSLMGTPVAFTWQMAAAIAIMILLWLWTVSFQAAGATLVYLDRQDRHHQERAAEREVTHMSSEDVRALWKNRMGGVAT